jgi:hypothetical protein
VVEKRQIRREASLRRFRFFKTIKPGPFATLLGIIEQISYYICSCNTSSKIEINRTLSPQSKITDFSKPCWGCIKTSKNQNLVVDASGGYFDFYNNLPF